MGPRKHLQQLLAEISDGYDNSSTDDDLFNQLLWKPYGSRGDQHSVERPALGPTDTAVIVLEPHIAHIEGTQPPTGAPEQ